jgi:DNA-directed RNA polymerase specialized sigma subunit
MTQNPLLSDPITPTPTKLGNLEPDLIPHYAAYTANPTPQTRGTLLNAVKPILRKGVTAFAGNNVGAPIQLAAKKIALDSFDRYDPAKSTMQAHLMSQLQGLYRVNAQYQEAFRAPERIKLDSAKLLRGESELRDRLGRDPSDGELADHTNMSLKRMHKVRGYRSGFTAGQAENFGSDVDGPMDPAIHADQQSEKYIEFIYDDLDPVDKAIVDMRYGRNGRRSASSTLIAKRLGLSPAAISMRSQRIQQKLDSIMDAGVF